MKKLYFLLVAVMVTFASFGQTTVFQESFETGSTTATLSEICTDNGGDFFTVTDGSNIGSFYEVTGMDGTFFFAAQDTDGSPCTSAIQTMEFDDIDISTFTNLTFAMLVAEDDDGTNEDWDDGSSVTVEVDVDNSGTFTTILQFEAVELRPDGSSSSTNKEPALDTNFDGVGDGTRLSAVFQEFTAAISSGNLLDIKITFTNLKNGDEDIAIDNIRVVDGFVASPTISIASPSSGTIFAPGTTNVDVEFATSNTSGSEQVNITVNGTQTTDVSSPFTVATVDGMTYNVTVELVNGGVLDSSTTDFSVGNLTTVVDIAALRADVDANGAGGFYEITGASLVTHTDGFRNRQWIQDSNIAGVLMYDFPGISTTYTVGDSVTGLKGLVSISNGVMQFEPFTDSGVIASSGNAVVPQVVTIAALNANLDDYESELIQIDLVTFTDGDGTAIFETNTNYDVTDGVDTIVKRTIFFSADYIGTIIPSTQLPNVVGIAGEFNGTAQIYVRNLGDLTASVGNNSIEGFSIYPNPVVNGKLVITTLNATQKNVELYNILGKQVYTNSFTGTEIEINFGKLNSGVYILKVNEGNNVSTSKLVVK